MTIIKKNNTLTYSDRSHYAKENKMSSAKTLNTYLFTVKYCLARGLWMVKASTESEAWQMLAEYINQKEETLRESHRMVKSIDGNDQAKGIVACIR